MSDTSIINIQWRRIPPRLKMAFREMEHSAAKTSKFLVNLKHSDDSTHPLHLVVFLATELCFDKVN